MNATQGPWERYTWGGQPCTWRALPQAVENRKAREGSDYGARHGLRNFQVHAFGPLVVAYDGDGTVYLSELDLYVTERVKGLTQGRQHPVTQKPTTIRSFPLAKP